MDMFSITAQLATIPSRFGIVRHTIMSLIPQVDELNVFINDLNERPEWFSNSEYTLDGKLTIKHLDNSTGDAAKFCGVEHQDGYIFTCDDDLIYPPDYVERTIAKIEQYERKAIITYHGRTLKPRPVSSYYASSSRIAAYRCLATVAKDAQVEFGGTGVMAFHSDTIDVKYSDFQKPNMADIWMAIVAKRQGVPIIVAAHEEGWLRYMDPPEPTIWDEHHSNDQVQTEVVNKWM